MGWGAGGREEEGVEVAMGAAVEKVKGGSLEVAVFYNK
jgi:hypothetical protein